MWLIGPQWRAFKRQCLIAYDEGDAGGNYGSNYWLIKGFALGHLRDALRGGEIHREWRGPRGVHPPTNFAPMTPTSVANEENAMNPHLLPSKRGDRDR